MNTLNPTNLKVVTGCALAVIIVCAALAGSLFGHPIDVAILVELCLFDASILGIAAVSRAKDRVTDYGYVERTTDGAAKVAAAKAGVSPEPTS